MNTEQTVRYEVDAIVLTDGNCGYSIDTSQCGTHAAVLEWVVQLAEKDWVTNDMLVEFIAIACEASNLRLHGNYPL